MLCFQSDLGCSFGIQPAVALCEDGRRQYEHHVRMSAPIVVAEPTRYGSNDRLEACLEL